MTTVLNTVPREQVEKAVALLESQAAFKEDVFDQMSSITWDMIETMDHGGMTCITYGFARAASSL
jgi:hypothetical protein